MTARTNLGEMFEELELVPPEELTVDLFRSHVERLEIPRRVIQRHLRFCKEWYTRSLLLKTGQFEVVLMGWKPGQVSSIHNHGDSFGVVQVLEGELETSYYDRLDDGTVAGHARVEEREVVHSGDGALTHIDVGGIHRMGPTPGTKKNLTTVHFYGRPLDWVETYVPAEERMQKFKVRYCFGETDCRFHAEGAPFSCLQKQVIPVRS